MPALPAMGITLSVDRGNLVARSNAVIADEVRSLIRAHRAELLALLSRCGKDCASSARQRAKPLPSPVSATTPSVGKDRLVVVGASPLFLPVAAPKT